MCWEKKRGQNQFTRGKSIADILGGLNIGNFPEMKIFYGFADLKLRVNAMSPIVPRFHELC